MVGTETNDLTQGPVGAHLRRQATPFAIGLVAIFSFEAIDLLFIAQLGDAPLAAVGFAMPLILLVYGIGIGFEAGAASVVSRAMGRKDFNQAARLTTDTAVLGTAVAIVIMLLGLALIDPVFRLLGATEELLPLVRDFMRVWYWVVPLDFALWIMLASIRARGNTLLESKYIVASALINLVLDPLLIFGLFGFPHLEIVGAALATVLATGLVLVIASLHLAIKHHVFASVIAPIREILSSWAHMLHIGIPATFVNAIIPLSSGVVVAIIATYGMDAVAGFGIVLRIEPIALIPFYALSAVNSPFFGQNIGAAGFDRLFEARRVLTRFCLWFGLALAVVMCLAAAPLARLYTDSQAIQQVTTQYIYIVALSWGAYGLVMSVNSSFNGSGRPLPGVVITSCRVVVLLLPLIWIGESLYGLPGLFAAIAVSNISLAILAWVWLGRHISRSQSRYLQSSFVS